MKHALAALLLVATTTARADDASIAKALRSLRDVHQIASVLEMRRALHIEQSLDIPPDPWGHAFRTEITDAGYRVIAAGADGTFDESTWASDGQFEGVDVDVVFENGKVVRSNRNWLAARVNPAADSGAAYQELVSSELMFMAMTMPEMRDAMASRVTMEAMQSLAAKAEEYAASHNGSVSGFTFDETKDAWGTNLQFRFEGERYRIVSAGSDRKFEPMTWERPPLASTTEDLVLANGRFVREHDLASILAKTKESKVTPIAQPVDVPRTAQSRFVRIDKSIVAPKVLTRVEPAYPEGYRMARISGIVIVDLGITETGAIEDVRLVKSLAPALDESALRAVKQWTFAPATRENQPIAVLFNLTINFKLTE